MMLWGRMIEAERSMRRRPDPKKALVPATWQLVRQTPDARLEVLAKNVLSYDLCDNGGIVYTDGRGVFHLPPGGAATRLCSGDMIERVVVAS